MRISVCRMRALEGCAQDECAGDECVLERSVKNE